MKKLFILLFALGFLGIANAQTPITYTNMTAAGYQYKYLKADSGIAVPNIDTTLGRGTRRPGSVVMRPQDSMLYIWNGRLWSPVGTGASNTTIINYIIDSSIVINYFNTYAGVDSVTYDTATGLMCIHPHLQNQICYEISTDAPPITTGVDSVVILGNQLCQYSGGVPTCYTITNTINEYITNYVDSSITNLISYIDSSTHTTFTGVVSTTYDSVTRQLCVVTTATTTCYVISDSAAAITTAPDSVVIVGPDICVWKDGVSDCHTFENTIINNNYTNIFNTQNNSIKISGEVVYDSLLVYHGTPFNYYILGRNFSSELTYVTLDEAYPSTDRTDVFYVDTLGNFGVLKGGVDGLTPQVDPSSQLAVAEVTIPAADSEDSVRVGNVRVYFENIEWTGSSSVTGANFDYATNPYEGLKSAYFPNYLNNNYILFEAGATYKLSDVTFVKLRIRLINTFRTNNRDYLSIKFQENGASRTNYVSILNGNYGFDRTLVGVWQDINIPMARFQFGAVNFNEMYFNLAGAGSFQLDNIQLQTGTTGLPVNVGNYVQTVDGKPGPHVVLNYADTMYNSADSSVVYLKNKVSGTILATTLTHLTYLRSADTCLIIDTIDSRNFTISFNQFCGGSGSGGSGITALTGDVTASGTGSVATTLATVNSNVGTFGSTTQVPVVTVNAKGLVTGVTNTTITQVDTTSLSDRIDNLTDSLNVIPNLNLNNSDWLKALNDSTLYIDTSAIVTNITVVNDSTIRVHFGDGATIDRTILGKANSAGGGGSALWTGTTTISPSAAYRVGVGTTSPSSRFDITTNSLAVSALNAADSSGLTLNNTTAAVLAGQQYPPTLKFRGYGWGTTAGTSQSIDWRHQVKITQGTTPTSQYTLESSLNGAVYVSRLSMTDQGVLTANMITGTTSIGTASLSSSGTLGVSGTTTLSTTNVNVGINTTSTQALNVQGATSTAGIPNRWSPWIGWRAHAWNTTSVADNIMLFGSEVRTTSGAAPVSRWVLWSNSNGAGIVDRLTVKNSGVINFSTATDYADNAAALAAGLVVGDIYRTGDLLKIVH